MIPFIRETVQPMHGHDNVKKIDSIPGEHRGIQSDLMNKHPSYLF